MGFGANYIQNPHVGEITINGIPSATVSVILRTSRYLYNETAYKYSTWEVSLQNIAGSVVASWIHSVSGGQTILDSNGSKTLKIVPQFEFRKVAYGIHIRDYTIDITYV